MTTRSSSPHIGYVIKTFPKLSETFILREILALERQGARLTIFSLQPPTDDDVHFAAENVSAPIVYLCPDRVFDHTTSGQPVMATQSPMPSGQARMYPSSLSAGISPLSTYVADRLAVEVRRRGIDCLHAHFANEPTDITAHVHWMTGIPFSFTAHAKDIYTTAPIELAANIRAARFVVTCTDYNRRCLERLSTSDTPIYCLYHGIDLDVLAATHFDRPTRPHDPPLILSVGRFREKKGFLTLIEACARLRATGHRFRGIVVGYGPLQPRMEARIEANGLQHQVHLLGKQPHHVVLELYRAATLFVLPCQIAKDGDRDGIPNVLLEAMAMKLPVVTTGVSGIPELVHHGENGLLVPPENPEALAERMAELLNKPIRRRQLAASAFQTVNRRFRLADNVQALNTLLCSTMQAPLASSPAGSIG